MILLVCTEVELLKECDVITSPNDEYLSEIIDSGFERIYLLNCDSYSDSSYNNSASLYEVNFCDLNETQNVDFTRGIENRMPNCRKNREPYS